MDEIEIVKPEEMDKLAIQPGEDRVTLMTCTPYGVNTHRLLLHAKRISTEEAESVNVTADAIRLDTMLVVPAIAAPLVILLLFYWAMSGRKRKQAFPHDDPLSVLNLAEKEGDHDEPTK